MPDGIGILTYHSAINYGAVLQAYALQRSIDEMGGRATLLDYRPDAIEDQYRMRGYRKCSSLRNFGAHNLNCLCRRRRRRGFARFWREHLSLSPRCTKETIGAVAASYRCLITGSDQVLNPACHKGDTTYLLDFAAGQQKFAYAASMGSLAGFAAWGEEPLSLLADFAAISLREGDAAAYLSAQLGRACPHTVDPVWLLSPTEWERLAVSPREKGDYIFIYNLMNYPYMRSMADKLSAKLGLPIVSISKSILGDARYRGTRIRSNASPEEFLGYIRGAACVLTDSFHGTSFSILFGRPFFTALDPGEDNTNSRLLSLLQATGLTDHAVCPGKEPFGTGEADFTSAHARMQGSIERSRAFLQAICH